MYTQQIYFLSANIFIFYTCHVHLLNNEQLVVGTETPIPQIKRLLEQINLELQYEYIVFVKDGQYGCVFEEALVVVNKPIMVFRNLLPGHLLQWQHSNNFLLVTCSLEYFNQSSVLNAVYQYVPHLIWLDVPKEQLVRKMLKFCYNIHKSGYFQNLIITRHFNCFRCDFQRHLEAVHQHQQRLFVNPFLDMQGLSIITETDQLPPRSILFYDHFGQLKLIGFVANYLTTFAQRHNASLVLVPPANLGVTIHYSVLANKTFQGQLDIAAVVAPMKVDTLSESYSYPVELMEYCYMIPLPHTRPTYHVYFDIIEVQALLILLVYFIVISLLLNIGQGGQVTQLNVSNVLLNDKIIRGLLGQSFVMPHKTSLFLKYILFLLCFSSILLSTSYQAYLQSHLVHPPLEKRMATYEDIRRNNFKILLDRQESAYMNQDTLERQRDLFILESNFYKLLKARDSMDTRYIFPVSQTRWSVFQERQKLFQRKLFYYSSHLCLNHLVLLSFPLRPGLPYKYQLNQHILDVRDTGLLDRWLQHNFLNMVRLKLSSFKDLSVADEYGEKLNLNDFLWIWISYAVCISISLAIFAMEIFWCKI